MPKAKSNGLVGKPLLADAQGPPPDPFDQVKTLISKMGDQRYAAGYRRAMHVIARGVGQLDSESRTKLEKTLDMLELELHKAEEAAR